jgi:prevent-host-death family protein
MKSVGTFEAKTHLSELIKKVANGERIVITKRGKPVAMLVPPEAEVPVDVAQVVSEMLAYRDKVKRSLGGGRVRDLAHEGHKY